MIEVVDGTDQRVHLYGVAFLVVGFEALGQAVLEVAASVNKYVFS